MSYDAWKTTEPDPHEWDTRDDEEERCPYCGAPDDELCEHACDCEGCRRGQRLRELDVNPEGDAA